MATISPKRPGSATTFALHFKDQGFKVNMVNVGEAPNTRERDAKEKYASLKAQLYWSLRERFKAGDIWGLTDRTTFAQIASIQYEQNSRGQTVIESKEKARARGVTSPDRAEALMLAYCPTDWVSGGEAWVVAL